MNKVAEIIQKIIFDEFKLEIEVSLTRPKLEFGDFATNIAMQLAGKLGKNPREIAEILKGKLELEGLIESVSVAGPGFINLTVSASKLERLLSQEFSEEYGASFDGEGKTAIVEYPSPNMAKPTHSASREEVIMPNRIPRRTRSSWPAPTFWLTKVASAMEKQVTGRKANPSTLL